MSRERSLIYVVLSIVVAIVVLLFLARPEYTNMNDAKDNLEVQKEELQNVNQKIADTNALITDFDATSIAQKNDLERTIPSHFNQAEFIAQMETIGKDTQALVTNMDFAEEAQELTAAADLDTTTTASNSAAIEAVIDPSVVTVSISILGEYGKIIDFIESLEQNKRIINVKSVSIGEGEGEEGTEQSAQLEVMIYYLDSGVKPEGVESSQVGEPVFNDNL